MVMHWFLAISNSCNGLKYVTRFSCDTFGFYVALIYLQKGVQVLTRQLAFGQASLYLSIMVALLVLMVAYGCGIIGNSLLFQRYVRKFIEDYGTPLTIIFFTGFVHIGHMRSIDLQTLPTSRAFYPTSDRGWFVDFWHIEPKNVGIAFPFAVILTILFWFDHNGMSTPYTYRRCAIDNKQSPLLSPKERNSRCESQQGFIGTSSCLASPLGLLVYLGFHSLTD